MVKGTTYGSHVWSGGTICGSHTQSGGTDYGGTIDGMTVHSYPIMSQYLSNLILNVDVDFSDTISWGKLFQKLITL